MGHLQLVVNLIGLEKHVEDIVRGHVPVSCSQATASSRGAGADVSEDEVERSQDGIDQINLSGRERGKETTGEVKLSSEEEAKKGSKKLGNNDGSENSKEKREELGDLAEVKSSIFLGRGIGVSVFSILLRSTISVSRCSISIRWSSVTIRGSSILSSWCCCVLHGRSSIGGVSSIICKDTSSDGGKSNEVSGGHYEVDEF